MDWCAHIDKHTRIIISSYSSTSAVMNCNPKYNNNNYNEILTCRNTVDAE